MRERIRTWLELVKFEHTIFALPFAYLGMVLAARGWPGWPTFIWITVAMAAARTLAFAVNRFADRHIDARNPRTQRRPLPQGKVSPRSVVVLAIAALVTLVLATSQLNTLVMILLPGAVIFLAGYSYTKRFTWTSHWILGITDGMATPGAWAATRGDLAHPAPWLLWLAIVFWMAGFDIIYACQDFAFDRAAGLHAFPARFGIAAALRCAAVNHVLMMMTLVAAGWSLHLGWPYWAGLIVIAGLLWYEHSLVKPDDLTRVNIAFFNVNGYISVLIFVVASAGLIWQ